MKLKMKKETVDLIVTNASEVVTLAGLCGPAAGKDMESLGIIGRGAVAVDKGRIAAAGPMRKIENRFSARETIDAAGCAVLPGFVDPHTHAVFAGTRENEFEMRLRGATYVEITKAGGGIHSSVRAVRKAAISELVETGRKNLAEMLAHGTTTAEIKSGYGLTLKDELKMLRAIRRLAEEGPVEIAATFLGAHEIPVEYKKNREEYIRIIIEEMLPAVAAEGIAEFCDVFTEAHVFTVKESRRIFEAAKKSGLGVKIHADEIEYTGGAELAAELGAVSADHLVRVSDRGIKMMKKAGVIPVLLPGTTFCLRGKSYAPARRMISEGLPVALATDLNPGTCFCRSMQTIIQIACLQMGMTPAEALTAATLNAAYAIGRGERLGSIEPPKQADMIILRTKSYRSIPYELGANLVKTVIKDGKIVYNSHCEER
jgi:imidazolonepropionase